MAINDSAVVPLYQQVKDDIRAAIESGKYKTNEKIPPEPELSAEYSVSRITVTLRGTEQALNQLILQTERLEVTRQVFELTPDKSLQRELLLLKVACNTAERAEMREIAAIYKSKIIDLSPDSMVFELTGRPEKINAFLKMFSGYDILELCRTGITALERGGKHQHMQKPAQEVRDAQLPLPGTKCH